MTATHVLFVPWTSGSDQEDSAKQWVKFGNKHKSKNARGESREFKRVIYKMNTVSENLKRMQTGQLYVMGHGAAGYGSIHDVDGDNAVPLSALTVAERLIEMGLQPEFAGEIKCYSCHSAARSSWSAPSFAEMFAAEMRNKGYRHCQYFGYNRYVIAAYGDLLGNGDTHRHWAHAMGKRDGKETYAAAGRASEHRRPV